MRFVSRHAELHVGAGFVQEVTQHGAGDDVGGGWAAAVHGGSEHGHAAIGFKICHHGFAHFSQLVEAFFVRANEKDCGLVGIVGLVEGVGGRFLIVAVFGIGEIDETYVHVQVAVFIEPGQAERDPAFVAPSFNSFSFEEHIKYELEIGRVERVSSWSDNADKLAASNNETIQECVATL